MHRQVDFEGVTALDYGGINRWYDHWFIILRLRGSLWPTSLVTVATSMGVAVVYHYCVFGEGTNSGQYITNPTIFAFYMQTAGMILAFMTSICYGRYWEALSALCQMGQSICNVVSLAFSFESDDKEIEGLGEADWKAQVVHTASLLHATCISCLMWEEKLAGKPLDVFGGMTDLELSELNLVEDQPALVLYWLQDILASRIKGGGMNLGNPPVVAQVWACMVNFANAFAALKRIAQFPLPLPLHHALAFSDIFVAFLSPFVICAFVPNLTVCLLIVFATSSAYHGIFLVNVALQQPFGAKCCHLPLGMLHRQVIKGLLALINQPVAEKIIDFNKTDETDETERSQGSSLTLDIHTHHPSSQRNAGGGGHSSSQGSHHPDFLFPAVDRHYIHSAVEKRHKAQNPVSYKHTIKIRQASMFGGGAGNDDETRTTPAVFNLNRCTSTGFTPIPGEIAPLMSTKHPALLLPRASTRHAEENRARRTPD